MEKNLIFKEISEHLMKDKKPSEYIKDIIESKTYDIELIEKLYKLKEIDQNLKYHPEGNVLNHVLMVVDNAARVKASSNDGLAFMWGALLHDIGKLTTTKIRKGRITSYNHDVEGEKICKEILNELTDNQEFKYKVSKLVRYHMQPLFFDENLPFFSYENLVKDIDYNEIALISTADRLGRGGITKEIESKELERIEKFRTYLKTREGN